jgi:hypothetical protein
MGIRQVPGFLALPCVHSMLTSIFNFTRPSSFIPYVLAGEMYWPKTKVDS